jgi:SAM-dependent methyltransferase/mannose-6-phosphate isomerase-like protein (cupin superfamily)
MSADHFNASSWFDSGTAQQDILAEFNAMNYTFSVSTSPSFTGKGLVGYAFGPLKQKDLVVDYVEVERGHDTFMISNNITRTYYIISGSGYFTINDHQYPVSSGMLVEVLPKVEYCYSGKMTLILFQRGRWLPHNDTHTKWNPDVVEGEFPFPADDGLSLTRLTRLRIFGKSPVNAFLRLNRVWWNKVPGSFTALAPIRSYGRFLHRLARLQGVREQAFATHFLRNRPQLELIRRLVERRAKAGVLRVAVVGCSIGAEAYSVAWRIRSARPDLKLKLHAVDISKQAVEIGKRGVYSLVGSQWTNTDLFERMTGAEIEELFDRDGDALTVKSWIREGIKWHVGDAGEPEMIDALGPQDIVVANNFLCHMDPPVAEKCLRNIARLVSSDGYLFVSGIDLDVRTKVGDDLGWRPLEELFEEIHEGDPCMRNLWPFHYVGLEPLNKNRLDWRLRYAAVFQLLTCDSAARNLKQLGTSSHGEPVYLGASATTRLANESIHVSDDG